MALKTFNPTTPGQRQLVMSTARRSTRASRSRRADRGQSLDRRPRNTGRSITVRFRGGGHKKAYRIVDFKRTKVDVPAKVERLEYIRPAPPSSR